MTLFHRFGICHVFVLTNILVHDTAAITRRPIRPENPWDMENRIQGNFRNLSRSFFPSKDADCMKQCKSHEICSSAKTPRTKLGPAGKGPKMMGGSLERVAKRLEIWPFLVSIR